MKQILPKKRMRTTLKAAPRQKRFAIKTKISQKLKKQRQSFQKIVSFAKFSKDTKKAQRAEEFVKTVIVGFAPTNRCKWSGITSKANC